MGKRMTTPILPAYKRARCSNPSRFMTDGKRAFEIGRGGMAPPAWVESNHGMMMQWQAGYKQRQTVVAAFQAAGKNCMTAYEKSLAKAAEEKQEADDALLEQQMATLREAMEAAGVKNLTRQALMAALRSQ